MSKHDHDVKHTDWAVRVLKGVNSGVVVHWSAFLHETSLRAFAILAHLPLNLGLKTRQQQQQQNTESALVNSNVNSHEVFNKVNLQYWPRRLPQ